MTPYGHYANNILAVVVAREDLFIENMQTLADQVIAYTAGTSGQLAVNA